jgi:2-polyprenyl-3-methyl-5-hydroxy-6-metoxy-1,4-benzoquinol methylase
MKTVTECVVCSGKIEPRKKAMVAPFIARRIWKRAAFPIEIVECVSCGFIFFNPRLDSDEEERLYSGYRSDEYQEMRNLAEPWYTKKFNQNLQSTGIISLRQQKIATLLRAHLSLMSPKILDFGGNRGELVQGLISDAQPYVYDISKVTPLAGVQQCRDLVEAKATGFDLIVNSNVLEHVGFPRVIVDQMASIASPGTMAFIEVPCESPFDRMVILKRIVQECVLALSRPGIALSLARPSGFYLMHEHINFFTPRSLGALMTAAGWSVTAADRYSIDGPLGKGSMAWCVARK